MVFKALIWARILAESGRSLHGGAKYPEKSDQDISRQTTGASLVQLFHGPSNPSNLIFHKIHQEPSWT